MYTHARMHTGEIEFFLDAVLLVASYSIKIFFIVGATISTSFQLICLIYLFLLGAVSVFDFLRCAKREINEDIPCDMSLLSVQSEYTILNGS